MERSYSVKNPLNQSHKKYAKISTQVRRKLINRVINQGKTICSSAKYYRVKFSTAKAIVRKFKQTGQIFTKKTDEIDDIDDIDSQQEIQQNSSRDSFELRLSPGMKQAPIKLQESLKGQSKTNNLQISPQKNQNFHVDTLTILNAMQLHFLLSINFQYGLPIYQQD